MAPLSDFFYLFDGRDWMEATDVMGPWKFSKNPPEEIVELDHIQPSQRASATGTSGASPVPEIIVATKSSELIVTDGPAKYTAMDSIGLEVVSNTDSRILRDSSTQNLYVLLSGRWYTGSDLKGPWTYVASNQLPASFAKIPADSSIGEVRTHVAGTPEANDAMVQT